MSFITLLLFSGFLYAEEEDEKYPPEGMEIIKVGGTKFLAPKGSKVRKKGGLNVVEDITEYSSRKFSDIQKQFENIETKYNNLANETKEDFKRLQIKQEEGDLNVVEDITEYSSRKFSDIQKKFENIETKHNKLTNETKRKFSDIQKQFENIETKYNNLANETKEDFKRLQIKQEEIEKALKQIKKDIVKIKGDIEQEK